LFEKVALFETILRANFCFLSRFSSFFFLLADQKYRRRQRIIFLIKWLWAPLWTEARRIARRVLLEVALTDIGDALLGQLKSRPEPAVMYITDMTDMDPEQPNGHTYETIWPADPRDPPENVYDVLRFPVGSRTASQVSIQSSQKMKKSGR
jgi:hypothetical protein